MNKVATMLEPKLYDFRLGFHVNYNTTKSYFGSTYLIKDNEPVNLYMATPEDTVDLIKALEAQLEWYRSPLCQWAKRKTRGCK